MNNLFYIGATGLSADQSAVDIVANNIANMNTPAFKRANVSFSELLTTQASPTQAGGQNVSTSAGVGAGSPINFFTQGDLRPTANSMDLAIRGDGFIEVQAPSGQAVLWRGGVLHVGDDGYLAAPNGAPLAAMISVPHDATAIAISATGLVQATLPNQSTPLDIGQIELATISDTRALQAIGGGFYKVDDDGATVTRVRPGEDNSSQLAQGFSEASNVQLSDEMVNLMIYQRAYAANARLVQIGDELMQIANGLKR